VGTGGNSSNTNNNATSSSGLLVVIVLLAALNIILLTVVAAAVLLYLRARRQMLQSPGGNRPLYGSGEYAPLDNSYNSALYSADRSSEHSGVPPSLSGPQSQ
jgi:hypothetical protein